MDTSLFFTTFLLCQMSVVNQLAEVRTKPSSYTLQDFVGSVGGSLTVNVADYAVLLDLVRDQYYGCLLDRLDVKL
jgi:hypothetical protein